MKNINWQFLKFNELSPAQLYDILQLRTEVFVVEQNCVYQDMDYKDHRSLHLAGYDEKSLVAYARILPPGLKFEEASIGRIVTSSTYRKQGLGISVVQRAIDFCKKTYPEISIRISAQCYLDDFYKSFGFKIASEVYLEDGIDHQEMLLEI